MNTEIAEIIGLTPISINQAKDNITMTFEDGSVAVWCHVPDCCESVTVEDVCGDWKDLIGHPILVAEERVNERDDAADETWTFYAFRSIGGSVDVRWCGSSNGYYSEKVSFSFTSAAKSKDSFGEFRKSADDCFKARIA